MKNHKLKYQASRRIEALKKMCAMVLAWVCKMVCKDTPVLVANKNYSNPYKVNFGNTAKAMAVAASMPIVAVPIQDVQLLDYAVAHETVNATYGMTASTDDDIYLGLTEDPYTSDQQRERDEYQLDDENWNEVVFEEVNGGSTAKLALHNDWIENKAYQVDAVVEMNLPEQGISGPFRIISIKHIIPQKKPTDDDEADDYNYRPVTALFTHESNQVFNISFDNGEELGVTYQHPIYSTTAGDWKLAGELEIGEEVLTKSGNTKVVSSTKKEGSETVYNLEVKELHNFLVGESGVVVHNNYQWILDLIHFPFKQVRRKLQKHGADFGFSTNSNTANVNAFIKHLEDFVSNNTGKKYLPDVNYKGQHKDAIAVLEESSRLMVVTKGNGEFITAYKMSVEQVTQLLNDKFIW